MTDFRKWQWVWQIPDGTLGQIIKIENGNYIVRIPSPIDYSKESAPTFKLDVGKRDDVQLGYCKVPVPIEDAEKHLVPVRVRDEIICACKEEDQKCLFCQRVLSEGVGMFVAEIDEKEQKCSAIMSEMDAEKIVGWRGKGAPITCVSCTKNQKEDGEPEGIKLWKLKKPIKQEKSKMLSAFNGIIPDILEGGK